MTSVDVTEPTPSPLAYATRSTASHASTTRLAVLLAGALGFTFLGGCFCIGVLYLLFVSPRTQGLLDARYSSGSDATAWAVVSALAAISALCLLTGLALVVATFRHDRATR